MYPVNGGSPGSQCSLIPHDIKLPPLQNPNSNSGGRDAQSVGGRRRSVIALPPITAMDDRKRDFHDDSAAVLRRLQSLDDDEDFAMSASTAREHNHQHHHPYHPFDAPQSHGETIDPHS